MGLWSISQLAHLVPGTRSGRGPAALSPLPGVPPPSQVPVWPLPLPGPKVTCSEWSSLETLCTITTLAPPPIPPRHFRHPTGAGTKQWCVAPTGGQLWALRGAAAAPWCCGQALLRTWISFPAPVPLLAPLHSQWAPASAPHTRAWPPLRHRGPRPLLLCTSGPG